MTLVMLGDIFHTAAADSFTATIQPFATRRIMAVKIGVLAKQVIDPEMPMAAFRIDDNSKKVVPPPNIPPVVNGFDENAVEAALLIKDAQEASVTVISTGTEFALDVMKKPLSMGADELVLLQDDAFENTIDSFLTAQLLAAAVRKLDGFDLIICGRQASDWDNAQVPLGVAEILGMSCISLGKRVDIVAVSYTHLTLPTIYSV